MQHIPFLPAVALAALFLSGCGGVGKGPGGPYDFYYNDPAISKNADLAKHFVPGAGPLKIHSSGVKLDPDTDTATVADDGNRVTGIEHLGDSGTDIIHPALRISYKRNGEDRNVTFRHGDFEHSGGKYVGAIYIGGLGSGWGYRPYIGQRPAHTNTPGRNYRRPTIPEDSPYTINSYGWWEDVTLPHVAVAGLIAGGGPEGLGDMQQRHYVIAGPGTSSDEMPVAGTANYAGVFRSEAYRPGGFPAPRYQRIHGAVSLAFDFEASTLAGSINDLLGWGPGEKFTAGNFKPWATSSFAIEGTISDTGFTGTLAGSDSDPTTPDASSARGYAGNIDGGFFGPGAENVGAAVTATRDLGGTENDRALFGYIVGAVDDE